MHLSAFIDTRILMRMVRHTTDFLFHQSIYCARWKVSRNTMMRVKTMTFTREGGERVKVQNVFCRKFCALASFQDNLSQNSHSKSNLELPDLYLEALREVRFFCNFSKYNSKLKPMKNINLDVWRGLSRHTSLCVFKIKPYPWGKLSWGLKGNSDRIFKFLSHTCNIPPLLNRSLAMTQTRVSYRNGT